MKPTRSIPIAAVALATTGALLFAACGSDNNDSGSSMYRASDPTTSAPARVVADVATSTTPKLAKPILVDKTGRTIYLFVPDGNSTASKVPNEFRPNWPPVTATSMPIAGSGVDKTKLMQYMQPDGTQQLSYNGHLLYLYIGDHAPGDINGQGLGNNWYAIAPSGDAVR
jgi:predicted lipoprotein with Yx(FWY)xxD motif